MLARENSNTAEKRTLSIYFVYQKIIVPPCGEKAHRSTVGKGFVDRVVGSLAAGQLSYLQQIAPLTTMVLLLP